MADKIRSKERNAIGFCCNNFDLFKKLDYNLQRKMVNIIESSIHDASIDKSRARNIPMYWESSLFIEQYSNTGYHVKVNLDINSRINKDKSNDVKYYFVKLIYNSILVNYLDIQWDNYQKNNTNISYLFSLPKHIYNKIMINVSPLNNETIGYMNSLEINPYINQFYIDELLIRGQQTIKIKYSEMYTCHQCNNKKTQMREIQTRSSDEGGTLFITCIVCGSTWRQY